MHQENVQQEKLKVVKARLNFEEVSQQSESGTPSRMRDLKKGSDLDVSAACPKVLNQGATDLSHQEREIQKEKRYLKGWRRVGALQYPYTRVTQGVGRTTTVTEILKVVTKVTAQEEQNSLLRNTITKEHPHAGRKYYQKVQPWVCEETDPFTPRICYFDLLKRARMPCHVKTYDGSEDSEDHLKIFQAATKVECWLIPTCCHMFNSILTRSARQKKCIKDPVEIHYIKQREGESTEDFMRRFKEAGHKHNFKKGGFKNQQRSEQRQDRFTLLSKSPKEILALEKGNFKAPPPMMTPVEKRNNNTFCEFHGEVGHNTDECMHLERQIEELLKNRKLSHVIKELKQNSGKDQPKANKEGETSKGQPPTAYQAIEERIEVAINPDYPEQTIMIGSTLTEEGQNKLCDLLQHNLDMFAWKPADMTGVPRHIAEHHLNIREGYLPVRQNRRGQAADRNQAIQEEVKKLIDAGIMKEIHYHSWLSNPVMVKKHDGSWRMYVDFKDLNNACPKDGLPPNKTAKKDEEKTAFIISQGIFCYSKMPFGLRNAKETYQRLVGKAFHKQFGRNLKVYVDDLVIKSRTEDEIIRDIEETFKTLREINMKLNLKKCTFWVEEGMFLGYKLNTKGIRGRLYPYTRVTQGVGRTTTVTEILKNVTKVTAQEEQNSLLRNTITKEHPHAGRKYYQKVQPWVCEETDPFTPRIRYFDLLKRTRMPCHVKTYDGSEDSEDHLKIFQATTKVECWLIPTCCHMFNSTLTGSAREAGHKHNFKEGGFKNQQRSEQRQDRFTVLSKSQKEILALEQGKVKAPPPMMTPVEKRNNTKFCDFYGEVGHNTDECMHLERKIEELLKNRKLSHVIKELKQNSEKDQPKANKEGETSIRSSSPYNGIIRRPRVRKIQEVPSTAHGMLKVPIAGGILTLKSSKIIPIECAAVLGPEGQPPTAYQAIEERIKHDGSWRMCVDFKDLNNACPKDGLPPNKMAKKDEENTAFIIRQGIFCYSKMPFGLRNARATYQRLVDKAFHKQIGRNLKVYVDDLVIKSHTEDEIIRDIEETFKTLREINMKLNLKKCTFVVEEGMFLGYKVNTKGIKVCSDKVDVVLSLPSSNCLKDVQKLNGKLASLNRFLTKSAEKSLPFFKTLKKCTKKSDFHRTEEAESAFKQISSS
nr:reverse transcriptase domain-containing protein [Tanacetum cinerariifolium]